MLTSHLRLGARHLLRHPTHSLITLFGLAIGIASCFLIGVWIDDEMSFDRFHARQADLYRIIGQSSRTEIHAGRDAVTPSALAAALEAEVPEVVDATRVTSAFQLWLKSGDRGRDIQLRHAGPEILQMFSFPLVAGDPRRALSAPDSIVITQSVAAFFFADEDPLGRSLVTEGGSTMVVTGVLEELPHANHLAFDGLLPFERLRSWGRDPDSWTDASHYTYVLLQEGTHAEEVGPKATEVLARHVPDVGVRLSLQPLREIHLYSDFKFDLPGHGDIRHVMVFFFVAVLLLVIAVLNSVSLTTARAVSRAKEVAIRKLVGAERREIFAQLLLEALLTALIALVLAWALVWLTLPWFGELAEKNLTFGKFGLWRSALALLVLSLLAGASSGLYPALLLSSFKPSDALKGKILWGATGPRLRQILVAVQFTITIVCIVATLTVYAQISFMTDSDLGFEKEHLVTFSARGDLRKRSEMVVQELLRHSNVLSVALTDNLPIDEGNGTGNVEWEGQEEGQEMQIRVGSVTSSYLETMGMGMVAGRFFSEDIASDALEGVVINQTAARAMGLEAPVGKGFAAFGRKAEILGVVKDFQLRSLHHPVEPLALFVIPEWFSVYCVGIASEEVSETMDFLREIWASHLPGRPFEYRFLDEAVADLYGSERKMATILAAFSALAIGLSGMGLFGLALSVSERRRREIGIRKVLGANLIDIGVLLSREYAAIAALATLIATPIAFLLMERWLEGFASRIDLTLKPFVAAAALAALVAFLAVGSQWLRSALAQPAESLRYE